MKSLFYWLYDNQDAVARGFFLTLFVLCIVGAFFNWALILFAPFLFVASQTK